MEDSRYAEPQKRSDVHSANLSADPNDKDFWEQELVTTDSLRCAWAAIEMEIGQCYTGLTRDSDFELALSTIHSLVKKEFMYKVVGDKDES
jgi:hypothetical protein